jgi:hypothetical protein
VEVEQRREREPLRQRRYLDEEREPVEGEPDERFQARERAAEPRFSERPPARRYVRDEEPLDVEPLDDDPW